MVSREGHYTLMGWFTLYVGITTRPVYVKYRCRQCGTVFDETDDDEIRDQVRDGR